MKPKLALRLKARRIYDYSSKRAPGELYVTRVNARDVYISWDAAPGEHATGIQLEVAPDDAIQLMEWLQEHYACEICGAAAPKKSDIKHRDELCYK